MPRPHSAFALTPWAAADAVLRLATTWTELAVAVPTVVGLRATRMAAAFGDPRLWADPEFVGMFTEKMVAGFQVQRAMMRGNLNPLVAAEAMLKPLHRKATANARRLSR